MVNSESAPEPPVPFPPGRTLHVRGRGEFFIRDSGGDRPPVMLLHGWIASADLNWIGCYQALIEAGYRVIALDHRGHGRGLRQLTKFRLRDCAADTAAVLRALGVAPAVVVGYSMGGAIGQLVARDHPDVLSGLVLSGTAQHWQEPALKRYWMSMGLFGLVLALFPSRLWSWGLKRSGFGEDPFSDWVRSELLRHSSADIAEAGRELGRFDTRPWLGPLQVPTAVVVTSRDRAVPPRKQRELAAALGAPTFDAPIDHLYVTITPELFNPALLAAIASVFERRQATVAAAAG